MPPAPMAAIVGNCITGQKAAPEDGKAAKD